MLDPFEPPSPFGLAHESVYDVEGNVPSTATVPFRLLNPHLEAHFNTLLSSSAYDATHLSRFTIVLIRYGVSTRRFDIVTHIANYLLRQPHRPIEMDQQIYRALFSALVDGGLYRTAEQVFCLAREETGALTLAFYREMMELYGKERKVFFGGKVFPGEPLRGKRAIDSGWALYRGVMKADWADWETVQARILGNTRFTRISPLDVPRSPTLLSDDTTELVRLPTQYNLRSFFNAALTLFYVHREDQAIPTRYLLIPQTFQALLTLRQDFTRSVDPADLPPFGVEDSMLATVARDLVRARIPLPPGIEYHLSQYPQFLDDQATSPPSLPIHRQTHDRNPYRIHAFHTPSSSPIFEQDAMDAVARSPEYVNSSPGEIDPSDWPLLVWASLEGRSETEYAGLPPGLWAESQRFKQYFEVSGEYLLVVGTSGRPIPFIPRAHRQAFLEQHWTALREAFHSAEAVGRLAGLGWWPGCRRDFERQRWALSNRGRSGKRKREIREAVGVIRFGSLESLREVARKSDLSLE